MVGNNLTEKQLQEIVDKTILYSDKDGDGKISYEEFCDVSYSVNTFYTCGSLSLPVNVAIGVCMVPLSNSKGKCGL